MSKIITISREFGSGGRTIGRKVAEKLGIPCYDQEIIEKIAQKSGFCEEFIREKGEYASSGSKFFNALSASYANGLSMQDRLWIEQERVITEIAQKEDCVIIGRCADVILQGKADCLKVFIHASMQKRAERVEKLYGLREESTERRLKDKDKRRKAYYQYYTDVEWGEVGNYHLCLDSGKLGIEKCVDIISSAYKN
ncbi:MAG: cytidylate kinase-like family protein [Clostridia bacterium]|nr:cytidylate kinase-like family protein [Clostridia bacterium]